MTPSGLAPPIPVVRTREFRGEAAPHPSPFRRLSSQKPSFLRVHGRALTFSAALHLLLLVAAPHVVVIDVPVGGSSTLPDGSGDGVAGYVEIDLFGPSQSTPLSDVGSPQFPTATGGVQAVGGGVQTGTALEGVPGGAPGSGGGAGTYPVSGGAAGAGTGGATSAGGGGAGSSAASILRPGYRDPRLYLDPPLIADLEKTPQQLYAEHLSARLGAVRDSMAVEEGRARTTSDWVRTDGSGNRWGLSSEGLHLGGITIPRQLIPSPRATGDNQTQQDARDRQRQRDEIQRQEQDRARRTVQEDRARSMREAEDTRRGDAGN